MSASRGILITGALAVAALVVGVVERPQAERSRAERASSVAAASALRPTMFRLLPLTAVKPRGWLRQQLTIQAEGLSGHLDEFWPDVGPHSAWLGGSGEGWERGPYFLDGLVPLAYLLDNPKLIAKARRWVDWTLTHQRPDGAMGPPKNVDWWPNMIMLMVLTQYQEATGDPRVVPLMTRYFAYHAAQANARPLHEWAAYRWQDEVVSILWLYERTGDAALLDLARTLHQQGFDWKQQFADFRYTDKVVPADAKLNTHVVNNAMALKSSAVWWRVSGDENDRAAAAHQLDVMDRYHLLPSGVHSGDEHYAGRNPSQGTELCAVVEGMFSIEQLIAILGDPALADRLEKIAYNALPAAFDSTMWAHQYDQQPNQVLCSLRPRAWSSNGPESNLFGLEPHFGCCTSNFHQGWPKFTASLWMGTEDGGVVAAAYAPSELRTRLPDGVSISIVEDTDYPFREDVRLTVNPTRAAHFPLLVRIPGWATDASVTVNGVPDATAPRAGTFHRIDRVWKAGDRVALRFPMRPRASRWYNESVALERGPLVFALGVGADWRPATGLKHPAVAPAKDWEVHPTTAWNYALLAESADPAGLAGIDVRERPVGATPFSSTDAPVALTVRGRALQDWALLEGSAAPPPPSPVRSEAPIENLTLIPYGAAKLRITAFPLLAPQ
jgi:DUF1680 family protein